MSCFNGDMDNEPREFALPVDTEKKATRFPILSVAKPHMRAFHLSWLQFFACFTSTFAAPPLLPVIRDNLDLNATDIGNAGIAAVSGSILSRIVIGTLCDMFGPRLASATLTLMTAPAVYLTAIADGATGFVLLRFFTGFSLATFVSTQFWMSTMFTSKLVGQANAVAAGWGNLGGGATQLLMPLVFHFITDVIGINQFIAWRISFFIPGLIQTMSAFMVMIYGQDLPEGNYIQLLEAGEKHKDNVFKVIYNGITNYRGWITGLCYGYCFGVELTVDNIIAQYYYDRFDLQLHTAGVIAASFGLANIFTRPYGGVLSDVSAKYYGIRGRLWSWWLAQTLGGVFCILLGKVSTLWASITVMLVFSVFVQASCGFSFGVVPFISIRSLGLISGMTAAGGNIGAVVTQWIFFTGSHYKTEDGITYMGYMIIVCTFPLMFIYFKQWGGMFSGPHPDCSEKDYYLKEWSQEEQDKGYHRGSVKFAYNSRSERPLKDRNAFPPPSNGSTKA